MKKKAILTMTVIASLLAMASCDGQLSLPFGSGNSATTATSEDTTASAPTTTTPGQDSTTSTTTTTTPATSDSSTTGTTTGSSDTGGSSGTDSSVSSPSSGSSDSSSGSEYVTESLNNGYEVQEGVPNHGSDIETDDVIDFIRFIGEECTPYDPFAGENAEKEIREAVEERGLSILKKGGVSKAFIDELEKILTDNPAYGETINALTHGGTNIFTPEQCQTLTSMVKDVVTASSPDEFAASLMALFNIGQTDYVSQWRGFFGILTEETYQLILEVASAPYKAFFQGVMEDSVSPFVNPTFFPDIADEETQFFFFRMAHQMLSTMFEKIDSEEISNFFSIILRTLVQAGSSTSEEEIIPLINIVGKIITECFPNRASFKTLLGHIARCIENSRSFDQENLHMTSLTESEFTATGYSSELAETMKLLQSHSDDVFNGLKFLAAFAKNMTEEHFQAFMGVVSGIQSGEAGAEIATPIVVLSKALASTATGFSVDNDKVWTGLRTLTKDAMKIFNSMLQSGPKSGNTYSFGFAKMGLGDATFDKIFDKVKEVSAFDPEKLTQEQTTDITQFVTDILEGFQKDSVQIAYQLSVPFHYEKGDTLSVSLTKMDTTTGEPESIPVTASDVTGFHTNSYHYGLASFEKDGIVFSFTYLVAPANGVTMISFDNDRNYIAIGEAPEIHGITYSGEYVDLSTKLSNFSTKERGHFVAFYQVEDTYYAFEYYVYDPKTDVEVTYQIDEGLYKGDIAYRKYSVARHTKIVMDGVLLDDNYYGMGTSETYLDLTTVGTKTVKLPVETYESASPLELDVEYTVYEAKSIEHYLMPRYYTSYYGSFGNENTFIRDSQDHLDAIRGWDDLVLYGKVTLDDGQTTVLNYSGVEVATQLEDIQSFRETLESMNLSEPGEYSISLGEGAFLNRDKEGTATETPVDIRYDYEVLEGYVDGYVELMEQAQLEFDQNGKLIDDGIQARVWFTISYQYPNGDFQEEKNEFEALFSATLPDGFVPDPAGGIVEVIIGFDGYHVQLEVPYVVIEK